MVCLHLGMRELAMEDVNSNQIMDQVLKQTLPTIFTITFVIQLHFYHFHIKFGSEKS